MGNWAATERMTARITLAEGLSLVGAVHLQPRVAWRDGPETALELLNREERFFPVTLASGGVVFVAKAQVSTLTYQHEPVPPDPAREHAARHIPLEVMMVGGGEYRGVVNTELPPNRARALDFLNQPEPFFALATDTGTVCINRHLVRAVRPLS
ncbi:MAG TPA: hypothetical protein VNJ71_03675 [Gemmatimonadales bacterium]|jgi:hypothetical protein|nr:hypothetical protein [Gemmatimonadales bacterium]